MKRLITTVALASLLVTLLPAAPAAAVHELTISKASTGKPFLKFDTALDAYDFDGDGRKEIIGHNENRHVYVFDSRDGRVLADLQTQYPTGWGARPINAPEVASFTSGGVGHVVVANSAASIAMFRFDGRSTDGLTFSKLWERRMTQCYPDPGMDAQPVLWDLDQDGTLEIIVQTEEVGVYALRADGSTMWARCINGGNGEPAVADMDFDGTPDVVFASDDGVVTRVNGRAGWTVWTFWAGAAEYKLGVASMPVGPTIGQVDGRGHLDVAVGARDTSHRDDPHANRAALIVLNGDNGRPLWIRQHANGTPLTYTHPVIVDVDKDGQADVLWADWNTVGHKPPFPGDAVQPWAVSGTPAIYRYDAAGELRYRKPVGSYWHNNDLAVADVDGDGIQEIIADDGARMIYIDSRTGTTETIIPLSGWLPTRGPTVFDLHGDGTMQWLLPVHKSDDAGIMVFDTKVRYDAAYPHVPVGRPATSAPPSGTFQATFTVADTKNNWWVEVRVQSTSTVTEVAAVVDGGPIGLAKTQYGTWARSFYVADGSQVVFKARDAQGREATSAPYVWGNGTPAGLQATFTVKDTTNNWWIETHVASNQPLAKVTASVNGGAPVDLPRSQWGTYAKSFHVPDGASVVFTATSTTGATASSAPFMWGKAGGAFQATFTVKDTNNNWWVETSVAANQPLAKVTASINGGSPVDLPRTDWGAYAKSVHVPDGAKVVFTATSTSGATVASQAYTWGKAGGAFQATFTVKDTTNNWWVETSVAANQPLAKVAATINGGSPVDLPRTDWGSYAKSVYVAEGAKVVLTATSTSGATATSSPYTWT